MCLYESIKQTSTEIKKYINRYVYISIYICIYIYIYIYMYINVDIERDRVNRSLGCNFSVFLSHCHCGVMDLVWFAGHV